MGCCPHPVADSDTILHRFDAQPVLVLRQEELPALRKDMLGTAKLFLKFGGYFTRQGDAMMDAIHIIAHVRSPRWPRAAR